MKRKAGIALLFLLAVTPANAYTRTVKQLYDDCSSDEAYRMSYCLGVVHGVGEAIKLAGDDLVVQRATPRQVMCPAQPVAAEAMVQAFKNWTLSNPKLWSSPEAYGVILALSSTWPCQ
jgi:hypothetical protein